MSSDPSSSPRSDGHDGRQPLPADDTTARTPYVPPAGRPSGASSSGPARRPQSALTPLDKMRAHLRARDEKIEALEKELAMQGMLMLQLRVENERLKASLAAAEAGAGGVVVPDVKAAAAAASAATAIGKAPLPPLTDTRRGRRLNVPQRPTSARVGPLDSARQLSEMD